MSDFLKAITQEIVRAANILELSPTDLFRFCMEKWSEGREGSVIRLRYEAMKEAEK